MKLSTFVSRIYAPLSNRLTAQLRWLLVILLVSGWPAARAQVTTYTDEGTFNAATAKLQFVEDTYEGIAPAGGKVAYSSSPLYPNGPIAYDWADSLSSAPNQLAIQDAALEKYLGLNGSAYLAAGSNPLYFPIAVTMKFANGPATAFGVDLGFGNVNGGDNTVFGGGYPGGPVENHHYPLTDTIEIQLYAHGEDGDVPVGGVFHAGSVVNGFAGFVSTVPFDYVTITANQHATLHDESGYVILDPYQMIFDNARFGQVSTLPTVTVVGSSPNADAATRQAGDFVLTLSAAAATDLTVVYTVKGSAEPGVDYVALKGTVKLKAGTTSKKIKVKPLGDLGGAGKKIVKLTLQPGTGYLVGTPDPVKVKIFSGTVN